MARSDGLRVRTADGRRVVYFGGVEALARQYPGATIERYADGRDYDPEHPPAAPAADGPDLAAMTRAELNDHAATVGVADPHRLPNKDAVIQAVQTVAGEPEASINATQSATETEGDSTTGETDGVDANG